MTPELTADLLFTLRVAGLALAGALAVRWGPRRVSLRIPVRRYAWSPPARRWLWLAVGTAIGAAAVGLLVFGWTHWRYVP